MTALLVVAGPLATLAGAALLVGGAEREVASLRRQAQPRIDLLAARDAARETLVRAGAAPMLGSVLEALGAVLPEQARIASVERDAAGRVAAEIVTIDPDALRSALRRDPRYRWRETGQRRDGAGMRVLVELQ